VLERHAAILADGGTVLANLLLVAGYPVAVVVIVRWVPLVREGRTAWFAAHQVAVAAIVAGWALQARWPTVVVNAAWLVVAACWYGLSRRRRP
jgi:hypothetical protein